MQQEICNFHLGMIQSIIFFVLFGTALSCSCDESGYEQTYCTVDWGSSTLFNCFSKQFFTFAWGISSCGVKVIFKWSNICEMPSCLESRHFTLDSRPWDNLFSSPLLNTISAAFLCHWLMDKRYLFKISLFYLVSLLQIKARITKSTQPNHKGLVKYTVIHKEVFKVSVSLE